MIYLRKIIKKTLYSDTINVDFIQKRLSRQLLSFSWLNTARDVVAHMGCMQAQDFEWSLRNIALRWIHITKNDILQALNTWEIIRSWPMRGTLHIMLPENAHWMLDLCASRTLSGYEKRRSYLGMDDKHAERALEIFDSVLRWEKQLTRSQLIEELKLWGLPMQTQWWYHLLNYAATRKLICFGPRVWKEDSFVLLDERVTAPKLLNKDQSLIQLTTTYFSWHGPATIQDLARWSGLSNWDIKKWVELTMESGVKIEKIEYNGKVYYCIEQEKQKGTWKESVIFLWWFDEYFIGYKERSEISDTRISSNYYSTNGIFFPLIMVDGYVVWTWKRTIKKNKLIIDYSIHDKTKKVSEKDLMRAAERYGKFLGVEDVIIW